MHKQKIIDAAFKDGVFNAKMASASRNKDLIDELEKIYGKFDTVSELIYVALNGISEKVCECGRKTAFLSFMKGYRDFCSAECASSSKRVKEKRLNSIESTCVERYGVRSTLAIEEVRQKSASTMVSRYGADNFAKTEMHRAKVRKKKSIIRKLIPQLDSNELRKELFAFLSSLGFECEMSEFGINVSKKNIAIEMNGVYWHHDESGKISLLEKSLMAEKAGVQVIHIWDYEWSEKQSIIKSILRSKLGKAERKLNARQCEVREIDLQTSSDFLETYHLQGSCRSSLKLGVFFKNELVGVATFGKPRFEKFEGLELLRMCFKENVSVRGGVSKLMSLVDGPILTYADARFSNGAGYLAAGFNYVMQTQPGYSWFHPRFGIVTRYESMKSKLPELLGESFDPNVTEDENMRRNKFIKLLDCGNNKLVRL